jgi:DNA gyrase/topoisomerase IV subunit B
MAAMLYLAPDFIKEGRLYWLRAPLYIVKNKGKESYYYTDEEFNKVRNTIKGEITRNKGLGEMDAESAKKSMFEEEHQRLDQITYDDEAIRLLQELMGSDVEPRRKFIFNNIDFSTIRE